MRKLKGFLYVFNEAQVQAFVDHEPKHPKDSVTDDKLHWGELNVVALEHHLLDEMDEYKGLKPGHSAGEMDDLVDLANMCFVVWTVRSIRAAGRPPR